MSVDLLKTLNGPVVLVGAGKMGGAILHGWLRGGLDPARVVALDPNIPDEFAADLTARGALVNPALDSIPTPSILLLAVKPQVAPVVLATVPAAIGQGITVAVPNGQATAEDRGLTSALLSALGPVEWIEDEDLMDAATAVSGSGPAYVFLLAEMLAKAGVAAGLPPDLADRLARATVAGSGALIAQSGTEPGTLRENVTSPAGTTAAALAVLMEPDRGFGPLLTQAVAAATQRGRELGA
ncbi:MAG: pyrroline-5-carboxylate reductase [Rhizobiales bacterium 32-66-8]|nr:MAG: pyrroline-5-carboxylate reductase [Rhizobiales bacterium 32-66-8]